MYSLIDTVTKGFVKLTDRFDPWSDKWHQESVSLGWPPAWLDVTAPVYSCDHETAVEQSRRLCAAKMLRRTIADEHAEWLRNTDLNLPQAIFRRMHLKFRGNAVLAQSTKLLSMFNATSMQSTRSTVSAYGAQLSEICRRLRELSEPIPDHRAVDVYLLGLSKHFDPIRFDLQSRVTRRSVDMPVTLSDATSAVESWAANLPDRQLLSVKDTSGRAPAQPVLTMFSVAKPPARPTKKPSATNDCRSWVRSGACAKHAKGECKYDHNARKKGVNQKTPRADPGATTDHTHQYCDRCKVKGHSSRWSGCPTKVADRARKPAVASSSLLATAIPSSSDTQLLHAAIAQQTATMNNLVLSLAAVVGRPIPDDASAAFDHSARLPHR